jgi:hypothetical protein
VTGRSVLTNELRSRSAEFVGVSIGDAERRIADRPRPLVRSAVLHMLWTQEFTADLNRPVDCSTGLESAS